MKRCPACGREVPSTGLVCQHCGASLPAPGATAPGAVSDLDRMIQLRSYVSEASALAASQALEANGVVCNVFPDDCGGMLPPLQQGKGLRLFVSARDAETALEILRELDETDLKSLG